MADFPELPEVHQLTSEEQQQDRFGRTIAIATVLTTLAAALVAFMQAQAVRIDDEAAVKAERVNAEALGQSVRGRQRAQFQIDRFELAEQQRRRAANARQARVFGSGDERELKAEEERWLRISKATDKRSRELAKEEGIAPITDKAEFGPVKDDVFPDRYFAAATYESVRLDALRDGLNAEGNRAEEQFTAYAVSLTMFAVAVFLFGYSLTPHGRPRRRLYAGTATAFVTISTAWALFNTLDKPNKAPEEAARAFADGLVALQTRDFEGAIKHLSRAIELRKDYRLAYIRRAEAHNSKGSPQLVSTGASLVEQDALEDAVQDLEKAYELGSEDDAEADLLTSLGFDYFKLGLENGDKDKLEESIEITEKAIPKYKSSPIPYYNKAVAQLALGRIDEARQTYETALQRSIFIDVKKKKKREDLYQREAFIAGAMTDMELVVAKQKDKADEVREIKERLDGAMSALGFPSIGSTTGTYPDQKDRAKRPKAVFKDITITVSPANAEFLIGSEKNFEESKDRISVQWYYQEPGLGWAVLEQISGWALENELKTDSDGDHFMRRSYLGFTRPPQCLRPGRYRAELYVNGRFAGQAEDDQKFQKLKPTQLRDLSMTFCRPEAWQPLPTALTGLVNGYQASDGSSGAFVVSVPEKVAGVRGDAEEKARQITEIVATGFESLLPGATGKGEETPKPFMGLEGELVTLYNLKGGGRALVGAGRTEDGELLVGVSYGPTDETSGADTPYWASESIDSVFNSFSQY